MTEPTNPASLFLKASSLYPASDSLNSPSKPPLNLKGLLTRSHNETPGYPGEFSGDQGNQIFSGSQIENVLSKLVDKVDDTDSNSSITVDISGKVYEILNSQLIMNPDSLLASPERERYLDPETGHYFFDRNRQAFELVLEYYQNGGKLRTPSYLGERLLNEEYVFFGLIYNDSSSSDEDYETEDTDSSGRRDGLGNRLNNFLNDPASSRGAQTWMVTDVCLILFSMVHFILDTRQDVFSAGEYEEHEQIELVCGVINIVSVGFFTVDLLARFLVAPCKLHFFKQITNWFDLIAIIPFYIDGLMESMGIDALKFKIFQLFRIARVARVLKVIKRSRRLLVIGMILYECLNELAMLFIFWGMGVFFSGSLMYFCENSVENTAFLSILSSCWWSVVTMSTLGYGDMVPATLLGKLLGAIIIFASTVFMAVPMTIIVTKFGECYEKMKKEMGMPKQTDWREKRLNRRAQRNKCCTCANKCRTCKCARIGNCTMC